MSKFDVQKSMIILQDSEDDFKLILHKVNMPTKMKASLKSN